MAATIDPGKAGFDPGRLERINAWMAGYVADGKFPGCSILIARDGKIVWRHTTGKRSIAGNEPYSDDTIVRIYSMTKPITSVAIMMLVEEGLLHLGASVANYLPEFSQCRALTADARTLDDTEACATPTVQQLLTHVSGLSYSFNPGLLSKSYVDHKLDFPPNSGGLEATTERLAKMPLAFTPGSRWNYSVGIDVAGRIIEVVAGMPLDRFFAARITGPLGMVDTGFSVEPAKTDRFADCYVFDPGNPLKLADSGHNSGYLQGRVDTFSGGGGLVSTLDDYFRFTEMLRRGGSLDSVKLLSPSTVRYMRRNHLNGDIAAMGTSSFLETPMTGVGFGIGGGIMIEPARSAIPGNVGDFSWGGLASTFFWLDPVEQLTVIFFTQLKPSSTYPNRAQLKALVHGALTGYTKRS